MPIYAKRDFPVDRIRQYLEPGPVVLVSSAHKGDTDIMTMGWHTVMEFSPSLVGCIIAAGNHSFDLIRKSRECVINIPTVELAATVARIGNCTGLEVDKFSAFGLTAKKATKVKAPLITDCFASFECRLHDSRLVYKYNFFIFEVVKAHVSPTPKNPRTLHYRGDGQFGVMGESKSLKRYFTKVS